MEKDFAQALFDKVQEQELNPDSNLMHESLVDFCEETGFEHAHNQEFGDDFTKLDLSRFERYLLSTKLEEKMKGIYRVPISQTFRYDHASQQLVFDAAAYVTRSKVSVIDMMLGIKEGDEPETIEFVYDGEDHKFYRKGVTLVFRFVLEVGKNDMDGIYEILQNGMEF